MGTDAAAAAVIAGAAGAAGTPYTNPTGSSTTISFAEFESAYTTYSKCISDYSCPATIYTNSPTECKLCDAINTVGTQIQSDPSYNATVASYANLKNRRNDLDLKLQGLYNIDNSIPNLYHLQNDSTVYTGILWTVLATTLIYYVFIKL